MIRFDTKRAVKEMGGGGFRSQEKALGMRDRDSQISDHKSQIADRKGCGTELRWTGRSLGAAVG